MNLFFSKNVQILLILCAIASSARSGWCERFAIELGPFLKFNRGDKTVNVPDNSPHTFDDLQFAYDFQSKHNKLKYLRLGFSYFGGESTINFTPDNPTGLSHISSHLWTAYVIREFPVLLQWSEAYNAYLNYKAGIGNNVERAGFTRGYSRTTNGISYNMSAALSAVPAEEMGQRKIVRYYVKIDIYFIKDTFDYEKLHLDQNAHLRKFRRFSIGEFGMYYRWLDSVSIIMLGRLCHYDNSIKFVIGSGLLF